MGTNNDDRPRIDKYNAALQLLDREGNLYWQTFGAFLLAHTVFVAVTLNALGDTIMEWRPALFLTALFGAFLTWPWAGTHSRSHGYHNLRVAQLKEAEPTDWNLIAGIGEDFSRGDPVEVGGEPHRMPALGRVSTTRLTRVLILVFLLIYLAVAGLVGPWWEFGLAAPWLTTSGLIADFVGVVIVARFGLPADFDTQGRKRLLLEGTEEADRQRGVIYRRWSRIGIGVILCGLLLQILGAWRNGAG